MLLGLSHYDTYPSYVGTGCMPGTRICDDNDFMSIEITMLGFLISSPYLTLNTEQIVTDSYFNLHYGPTAAASILKHDPVLYTSYPIAPDTLLAFNGPYSLNIEGNHVIKTYNVTYPCGKNRMLSEVYLQGARSDVMVTRARDLNGMNMIPNKCTCVVDTLKKTI